MVSAGKSEVTKIDDRIADSTHTPILFRTAMNSASPHDFLAALSVRATFVLSALDVCFFFGRAQPSR
jgi:hypothetical protein